jgi:threonine/homoserine/homoserine lactone efflux protein
MSWGAFAVASLVLAATPGPGVAYIVTRTLSQGRTAGLASVGGVALGNLGNALVASLGLAALLLALPWTFDLVRLAGAAYLIALGVVSLRAPADAATTAPPAAQARARIFRHGFAVALLNPKTALFFVAFLPQFIDPHQATPARTAMWGTMFVAIAACTDTGYVVCAHAVAAALQRRRRVHTVARFAAAAVYFALGLYTAFAGGHARA